MARRKSVKSLIKELELNDLQEVIVELCKLSKQNRQFLELYLVGSESANPELIVEEAKKKIYTQLYGRSLPKLDLRAARKVVNDYVKVLKEYPRSGAELKLYYVEVGTAITDEFGDMYEGFYNSMESMFDSFCKDLKRNPSWYEHFIGRMEKLRKTTSYMGWGYADGIDAMIEEVEEELSRKGTGEVIRNA